MNQLTEKMGVSFIDLTQVCVLSAFEMNYRDASIMFYPVALSTLREVRQRSYNIGLLTQRCTATRTATPTNFSDK